MKAVLVGPIQQENLALGYLAAFARRHGHEVALVGYADRGQIESSIAAILDEKPDLVGLGIAFQNNVEDYLLLLRTLRARGFGGHLTCGGHVATFCFEELLTEVPELDSVVRHDGEETLVELLGALSRGEAPRGIAGLVWRQGDTIERGPVRVARGALDELPWPERSAVPYTVGGFIVDFLITARGCVGECSYCSIAAYTSEQRKNYRLRAPEAVADEIAAQYHGRGARVFFVQDDLFVLPGERAAVERMDRIGEGLRARGVERAVLWVKGRPETITPAVCQAARRMGAIHMFLGVENASAERLAYLGRTHLPIHNRTAIERCRDAGIIPSFNFMLFDPDGTLEDVRTTLDLAAEHLDLPWNVCRTEVYSGTALRRRLSDEGRLTGDWRSHGYRMRDQRCELLFRMVRVALHERALAIESLLNRLISLSFSRQLHQELSPSPVTDAIGGAVVELGVEVRADTVRRLREMADFVDAGPAVAAREAQRYAVEQAMAVGAMDMPLRLRMEALWDQLDARGRLLRRRSGRRVSDEARKGWGVAAGS